MFKTALACDRANITFASVHDSFWTHASDMDSLCALLRKEFVNIYAKESILEKLLAEFKANYGENLVPILDRENRIEGWRPIRLPQVPRPGNFNVSDVLKSKYFFH